MDSKPEELEAEIEPVAGSSDKLPQSGEASQLVNSSAILVPILALLIVFLVGGLLTAAYLSFQRSTARSELVAEKIELTQSEFIKSVKTGSLETVIKFLKAGFSPVERTSRGECALAAAVERGNLQITESLLKVIGKLNGDIEVGSPVVVDRSLASLIETECKGQTAPIQNFAATKAGIGQLLLLEKYGLNIVKANRGRLSPLFCATVTGNINAIDILLAHGADLNQLEVSQRSILGYAALAGSTGTFSLLIERGADLKQLQSYGESAIFDVARSGNEAILALMLKNPVNLNQTNFRGEKPWQIAEAANNLELVPILHPEYLLYAGLTKENPSLVLFALERGARINISDRDGVTPLHVALSRGRPAQFRYLINTSSSPAYAGSGGALPQKKDATSIKNQLEAIRRLEKRLRPNGSYSSETTGDSYDEYSLFGSISAPSILLGEIDQGRPASLPGSVTSAVTEDLNSTIQFLLGGGASVTSKDLEGNTPLHYAVERGEIPLIEALLNKNAAPEEINSKGISPLYQAVSRRRSDIAELLLKHLQTKLPNKNLESVLVMAVESGLNQVAKDLLNGGMTPNLTDKANRELVLIALNQSNFDLAEALVNKGAILDWHSAQVQSLYTYSKKAKDTRLKDFMERFKK